MPGEGFPDACPSCGAGRPRAFVRYTAAPNDAQAEAEWADGLPEVLHALVCTDCVFAIGVVDARDPEDLPDGTGDTNDFRVDEELR